MYKYVVHSEIDYVKWDACIDNANNGTIYALSWYLNIVSPGWHAIIKHDKDQYISVFPITHFLKFGVMRFIQQPHFANQLGLVHQEKISQEDLNAVLEMIRSRFYYVINYPLNIGNTNLVEREVDSTDTLYHKQFSFSMNVSYQLDLSSDYKNLFTCFTKDRQNNVRKALKNDLTVSKSDDIEALICMFRDNTASRIYGGVKPYQYELLRKLFSETTKRGLSEIYAVKNPNNELLSSSLFFIYKNLIIKFFNASTTKGRDLNGDTFLMHHVLNKFSAQDKIFDFERASLDSINKYKESYGAHRTYYSCINYNNLPRIIEMLRKIRYNALSKGNN
jgi:hypothetical protein